MAEIYSWINFTIFVSLLFYFLRAPLRDFLGVRKESVRRELHEVARERLDVETHFKEYRKKIAEAAAEIEALKKDLKEEGELEKKSLIQKGKKFAEKIKADSFRIGEQELERAKLRLKEKTFLLAIDMAKQKIQSSIVPSDQERLVVWGIESLER